MVKPKLSVVVPIYNSLEFLRKSLDSLKNQTMRELEFILVNDGSNDGSLEVMREYKKNDSRFRIIDKENTGYGDSVNLGINKACGEYIGIVEPDDFCDKNMFKELYDLAEKNRVEIARGNYYFYSEKLSKIHHSIFMELKKEVFRPKEDFKIFQEPPAIWSAIYRTDFLKKNKIRFLTTPGASYQDTGFYLKTLVCAKRVAFTKKPLYYYRMDNPNSSVKGKKNVEAVMREYKDVEKFSENVKDGKLFNKYCQAAKFGSYNWNLLRLSKKDARKFIARMKEEFLCEEREGNIQKEYFTKKYWWSLKILLICPVWVYVVITGFRKIIK